MLRGLVTLPAMLGSLTLLGLPEDMNAKSMEENRKLLIKANKQCNKLIQRDDLSVELK